LFDIPARQVDKELLALQEKENAAPHAAPYQRSISEENAAALAAAKLACSRANPGACEMCSA
jgi:hypothetical protein